MTEKDEQQIPGYNPETSVPPLEFNPNNVHNELISDPKYAIHTHEMQITRIIEVIEELTKRLIKVEDTVLDLDLSVRFKDIPKPEGPPEPPTNTNGTTT
tara:strand:+ start:175 stop:471 length:297 start_codon:yes stop_codon:yes gene_type:complete